MKLNPSICLMLTASFFAPQIFSQPAPAFPGTPPAAAPDRPLPLAPLAPGPALAPPNADTFVHPVSPAPRRIYGPGNAPRNPRMVHFGPVQKPAEEALDEDLTVMALLLQKAVDRSGEDREPSYRMGIPMWLQSHDQPDSSYIDGFGALFQLGVNFPLVPAPARETRARETTRGNDWETARRELQGNLENEAPQGWAFPAETGAEYDAERVEALKKEILMTLKNGSNVHTLAANDYLAVIIAGPPPARREAPEGSGEGAANALRRPGSTGPAPFAPAGSVENAWAGQRDSMPRRPAPPPLGDLPMMGRLFRSPNESILAIRVRKSDADAFASGQLGYDQFKEKATVHAYASVAAGTGRSSGRK